MKKVLLFATIFVFCLALNAAASSAIAYWNANPAEDEVTHYIVYCGEGDGTLTSYANVTECHHVFKDLAPGTTYFFSVSAVNLAGESDLCDMVSITPKIESGCPGDFDNDGNVDGSDLSIFAADFGRTDCFK